MMKTLKKNAMIIAMAAIATAVFTACGTGNDDGAVQPKDVVATKAVVTTAAEQTKAEESKPETTTTITTTEPVQDSEPETEVTTTVDTPDETGIVTMADNPEGMYTLEECFRRKAEEYYGKKVVEMKIDPDTYLYEAVFEDGQKAYLSVSIGFTYEQSDLFPINDFEFAGNDILGYAVTIELMT